MDKIEKYSIENEIENTIKKVENNINNNDTKTSTFIYGDSGVGKTTTVKKILHKLNYNIYEFNILTQKNKNIIEYYDEYKYYNNNVMDIFKGISNKSIILIDNIELINSVDKNTLSSLIKLLRPKKNKKNNSKDEKLKTQIVIIGNNDTDKKIKELMKISNTIKFNSPTQEEIIDIIYQKNHTINKTSIYKFIKMSKNINYYLVDKFNSLNSNQCLDNYIKYSIDNNSNNNVKYINYCILKDKLNFNDDDNRINDTDKTTVSLLFHENIVDYINYNNKININTYKEILENFCFGDYMDRIIFQKQLWQLNEISFKIKVIYNNIILHKFISKFNIKHSIKLFNIRFTKILTKYSSEFNNYIFLINLCQNIDVDKKDIMLLFFILKNNFTNNNITYLIDKYNISILDINRIIKFISTISYYTL